MTVAQTTTRPGTGNGLRSVGSKLAGSTVLLILVVTAVVYLILSRTQRENLLQSKEMSAAAVTRLFVDSCASGVIFGDEAAVQESLTTLGRNDDVEYAAVWSADAKGVVAKRFGELSRRGTIAPLTQVSSTVLLVREVDRVVITSPIQDRNNATVGLTVVTFSLARENQAIRRIERSTLLVSAGVGIGLVLLLMGMARILVVGPLGKLVTAAKELEEGGKGEVNIQSKDEVGQLAIAFRSMGTAIRDREERIGARNRDMRLVLDNVGQGFVALDVSGTMSDERSRVVDEWFPCANRTAKFWDCLALFDSALAEWFRMGWVAIQDDFLPLDLCLDQLPKLARKDGRVFELAYRPILHIDRLEKIIVVIDEVTAKIERWRAEQAQREMMSLFKRMLSDRAALQSFFTETSEIVAEILNERNRDVVLLKRQLHTVKGNSALFGIESVSSICHQLEDKLAEADVTELSPVDRDALDATWKRTLAMRAQLMSGASSDQIEIDGPTYEAFLVALRAAPASGKFVDMVVAWRFEAGSKRLTLIAEQIRTLANRLRRAPVDVKCVSNGLRLPPGKWGGFWSAFSHVVRNTVDHGIQSADERVAAGKPSEAVVKLSLERKGETVVVSIGDDGKGIDWKTIASKARERGMPHQTQADLEAALFADGISTRGEVTANSGRGVGLSAFRETVTELGGHIEIETALGVGTTFRAIMPTSMLSEEISSAPASGVQLVAMAGGNRPSSSPLTTAGQALPPAKRTGLS